jgi:hypothetical protein
MKLRTGAIGLRTRAVAAVVMLTAGLMGMVTATSASANPIGTCGAVSKFTITFKTGGDDLRDNSELIMGIKVAGITDPIPLKSVFGPFSNHTTTVKANVTFATTGLTVSSCSIRGQELTLISHPNGWQGPDNWDMNSYSIVGHTSFGAAKYQHNSGPGFPRFRFTQSNPTLFVNDPV